MCDEKAMYTLQRQVQRLTQQLAALAGMGMATQMGAMLGQAPAVPKLIMNGSTMPPQVPGACGGQQACPPSLVSPATEAAIKSGPRTANVSLTAALAGLASGASSFVTIASNSMERTLVITDLVVPSITNLDGLRFTLLIGDNTTGREVDSFNGGRFDRGNANDCTTACGFGACVGPIETLTIRVTNNTGAALVAPTGSLDVRSIYRGEPGFSCGDCYSGPTGQGPQQNYPGSDQPVG